MYIRAINGRNTDTNQAYIRERERERERDVHRNGEIYSTIVPFRHSIRRENIDETFVNIVESDHDRNRNEEIFSSSD